MKDFQKINRIIIIGMDRSGTKWISNEISNHPDIIAIRDEEHNGILETNMFTMFLNNFNIENLDEYIGLIELWSQTDFFQNSKIPKSFFYKLNNRPKNVYKLFTFMMNELSLLNKKKYWLQKTSPSIALNIFHYFTDEYIVIIKRNIIDNLRSKIKNSHDRNINRFLIKAVAGYVIDEKISRLINRKFKNSIVINYEDLISDKKYQLNLVANLIRCKKFSAEYSNDKYLKNTSFKNNSDRAMVFNSFEIFIIKLFRLIFYFMPLKFLLFFRENFTSIDINRLVGSTFDKIKKKYNLVD